MRKQGEMNSTRPLIEWQDTAGSRNPESPYAAFHGFELRSCHGVTGDACGPGAPGAPGRPFGPCSPRAPGCPGGYFGLGFSGFLGIQSRNWLELVEHDHLEHLVLELLVLLVFRHFLVLRLVLDFRRLRLENYPEAM
ncbi:unnamed protein product [Caenorhabditis brenneri]